jgi:hypothetical protein
MVNFKWFLEMLILKIKKNKKYYYDTFSIEKHFTL